MVNYQFELKSSQLYLFLGGMVAVGLLLFLVGVIVGADSAASRPETVANNTQDSAVEPESRGGAPAEAKVSDVDRSVAETESRPAALPLPTEPGNQPRIWEIQFKALLDEEAANQVKKDVSANNLQPYIFEMRDARDRSLYTVRIGPWDSMVEAAEVRRTLRRYPGLDAYDPVIRHRPKPLTSNAPTDG
jgi:cell division septation protein DedD